MPVVRHPHGSQTRPHQLREVEHGTQVHQGGDRAPRPRVCDGTWVKGCNRYVITKWGSTIQHFSPHSPAHLTFSGQILWAVEVSYIGEAQCQSKQMYVQSTFTSCWYSLQHWSTWATNRAQEQSRWELAARVCTEMSNIWFETSSIHHEISMQFPAMPSIHLYCNLAKEFYTTYLEHWHRR